jgi:branched-chain amino acid transport system ATP-binding protein
VLASRAKQLAGSMSGGEQQMLTLARALMTQPRILHDRRAVRRPLPAAREPHHRQDPRAQGKPRPHRADAEQNFHQAIRIADRGYVIVHGRIEYEGRSRDDLANNELIHKLYMGL